MSVTRRRREKESWGDLGDDIRAIADCAFPDLDYKAREQLPLDRFLGLIESLQYPWLSISGIPRI